MSCYGAALFSTVSVFYQYFAPQTDKLDSQMSSGNLKRAWLRLRHFIAVAELMGLPKTYQTVQHNKVNGVHSDETQLQRAELWEALSSTDGLAGMVINLPPCSSPYQQARHAALTVDGVIQTRAYLSRLVDITTRIQYDDMSTTQISIGEFYTSVLELDKQLHVLASQTPKSWWTEKTDHVTPNQIVRFMHHCVKMRVHLSFSMRQDLGKEYAYSRLACTDACEAVAEYYQLLRRELPTGIFICQILDLQVLTSYSSPSAEQLRVRFNKARVDKLVSGVVDVMHQKSTVRPGSNFAQHGVTTIKALRGLLEQDDNGPQVQELTLKIPLLGKVYIRCNDSKQTRIPTIAQRPASSGFLMSNNQVAFHGHNQPPHVPDNVVAPTFQAREDFHWDPLSWSIDSTIDDMFQDPLMAENLDDLATWQDAQGMAMDM